MIQEQFCEICLIQMKLTIGNNEILFFVEVNHKISPICDLPSGINLLVAIP